ncbi:hypothetical protein [[Actinomadura] parvosata]|uniref:hypothetical protein n=1 Tax=[Actinomadura] parvosata TaxID=1955412 RepID=UPI0012BC14C3|nr:hypothetical protein [Nonomuraea sp. ATCC 55076]
MGTDFEPYTLHLEGVSIEAYILDKVKLKFRPPYIETAARPEAFEMWWKWLTYVFDLPDPARAPRLTLPLSKDNKDLVERYMLSIDDLLESSLLNVEQRFAYNVTADGVEENLQREFLSREVSRGVAVTFRQFYAPKEEASFERVYKALCKRLKGEPPHVREAGMRVLTPWHQAHNKLRGHSLKQLVRKKMVEDGVMGALTWRSATNVPRRFSSRTTSTATSSTGVRRGSRWRRSPPRIRYSRGCTASPSWRPCSFSRTSTWDSPR